MRQDLLNVDSGLITPLIWIVNLIWEFIAEDFGGDLWAHQEKSIKSSPNSKSMFSHTLFVLSTSFPSSIPERRVSGTQGLRDHPMEESFVPVATV